MKILLTHRYFWPDSPPDAAILRIIARHFVREGHKVHVFASLPSHKRRIPAPRREIIDGIAVTRCWTFLEAGAGAAKRSVNAALFCLQLFAHVLRQRPDVVTASTFPPVLAAWTASLAARVVGARFIYHLLDIHPEVSAHAGEAMGRWPLFHLMQRLDMAALKRSAAIVVLSEDMAETLRQRDPSLQLPIHVIGNFALEGSETPRPVPPGLAKTPGTRRVIFAGNLGRFQNLPLLAKGVASRFARHPDLHLMFLGDGVARAELEERWGGHDRVTFAPFLPFSEAAAVVAESDVGVVSLAPGIYRVASPSKLQTYLDQGVPVLALVEPESTLARMIEAEALGAVAKAAEPEMIGEALDRILDGDFSPSVARYRASYLDRNSILDRWRGLMEEIAAR